MSVPRRVPGVPIDAVAGAVRAVLRHIRAQRLGEQELIAVITRSSAERLRLQVSDQVFAVIKSTEFMIGKGSGRR